MFKRVLVAVALASAVFPSIASADAASVARNCASGGNCVALVNAEIANMGGSAAERNAAIADLVIALGNEGQNASPNTREQIADAVEAAARNVTDAEQRDRIVQIASTLRRRLDTQTAALGDDGGTGPAGNDGEKSETAASAN